MVDENITPGEKVFHVRLVAEITLLVPVRIRSRIDAMEAAEAAVRTQLECLDREAEVVGKAVMIQDDEEPSI